MAELDEEPVGVAWMHPGDVGARAVHLRAAGAQLPDGARNVGALEANEVDTLTAPREEPADGLAGIGRLEQLDVTGAERQDRVTEAEVFGFAPAMLAQSEQPRVPGGRRIEIADDDGQLDD